MFLKSKERLVKKFNDLHRFQKRDRITINSERYVKPGVINLCDDEIKDTQRDVLNLGPKFVPRQKEIPFMDIVAKTESAALKLEYSKKTEEAQDLRKNVLRAIKLNKTCRDNLTKDQRAAMTEIKKDENISIYSFDKGSGFVRIKTEDALAKIREQVGETKILDHDPTPTFARNIRNVLCEMNKKKKFTKAEYEKIYPSDPIPPRMYGSIKAHKPEKGYPMRTIVSTIGTATHGISEHLVKLIQPALNKSETRIKNSTEFVREAKTWVIAENEVQVSYDVVNLYPSVPLKKATLVILDIIREHPGVLTNTKLTIDDIKTLIELCLSKCYFLWNDEIHELEDSGPIGLSLMVVMAEGFLQCIEKKAMDIGLQVIPPIAPKSYKRFVDDSHARFNALEEAERFKEILNQQEPKIQYTLEAENEQKELQFLDITIKNELNGKYEFTVHRKKAITNIQVKPHSDHDPKILSGIFKGFVHRAFSICSTKYLDAELEFLLNVFIENGYKRTDLTQIISEIRMKRNNTQNQEEENNETLNRGIITLPWVPGLSPKLRKQFRKAGCKVVFKSSKNLKSILTSKNKSKLLDHSYPGIYKIGCEKHPNNPYIGETKLQIRTRNEQHQDYVAKEQWEKSGAAFHSRTCDGIIWDQIETLKTEGNRFDRKVREALEIQYYKCGPTNGGMNIDNGHYLKTLFWTPFFTNLRKSRKTRITSNNVPSSEANATSN